MYTHIYIYIYNDILCMKPIPRQQIKFSSSSRHRVGSPDSPDSKSITWALALGNHGMPEHHV